MSPLGFVSVGVGFISPLTLVVGGPAPVDYFTHLIYAYDR